MRKFSDTERAWLRENFDFGVIRKEESNLLQLCFIRRGTWERLDCEKLSLVRCLSDQKYLDREIEKFRNEIGEIVL